MATPSSSKIRSNRAFSAALVFRNESKAGSARALELVRARLKARGTACLPVRGRPSASALRRADLAIALGGDGTMLTAAREVGPRGIPLLGINMGTLGFLSAVEAQGFRRGLDAILSGSFVVESRAMLIAEVRRGSRRVFGPEPALNECVIRCGDQARAVSLSTRSGDRFVADFFGDGLIVATPTGSTAYSLAAMGPIVDPSLDMTLVAPICPHTLTQRPLILPADPPLTVRLGRRRTGEVPRVLVSLDGRHGCELKVGDEVRVRRALTPLRLILPPGRSFYEVLRRKLKWGQR
jgi:NAD+ kinase